MAEGERGAAGALRLFVACDLPDQTKEAIGDWQRRVVEPCPELRLNHALHLTLCFLGPTDPGHVARLVDALSSVSWAPAEVRVDGPLFLPARGPRRVVALSLSDPRGGLHLLQSRVSAALAEKAGLEPGKRPWRPHVTVARFRRPGQPFPLQNVNIPGFCVVRMALYSSLLKRAGAVHTPLAVFPAS